MKKNDILLVLIPSFIFVLTWIGFSIYHNIVTSTISQPLNVQIAPITPTFDTNVIDSLKNKDIVLPLYELSTPAQAATPPASPSAAPITIIVPTKLSTATINTTTATPEGSLTP
jgi:hypothetical protein